jgi:hypothetical protein
MPLGDWKKAPAPDGFVSRYENDKFGIYGWINFDKPMSDQEIAYSIGFGEAWLVDCQRSHPEVFVST